MYARANRSSISIRSALSLSHRIFIALQSMKYSKSEFFMPLVLAGTESWKQYFSSCTDVCKASETSVDEVELARTRVKALLCSSIRLRSIKNIKDFSSSLTRVELLENKLWIECEKQTNLNAKRANAAKVSSRLRRKSLWHQLHGPE